MANQLITVRTVRYAVVSLHFIVNSVTDEDMDQNNDESRHNCFVS